MGGEAAMADPPLVLHPDERVWLEDYRHAIDERYPGAVVCMVVYGSKARGDAHEDSDIVCCATVKHSGRAAREDVEDVWGDRSGNAGSAEAGSADGSRPAGNLARLSRPHRTGHGAPPKPELVKRLATRLGGDPDLLFRLAESADPDLAAYIHDVPRVPEFLRAAKEMNLKSEDFEALIEEVRRRRPSETVDTAET